MAVITEYQANIDMDVDVTFSINGRTITEAIAVLEELHMKYGNAKIEEEHVPGLDSYDNSSTGKFCLVK